MCFHIDRRFHHLFHRQNSHVQHISNGLNSCGSKINAKKCLFAKNSVLFSDSFLGHTASKESIRMIPEKVTSILHLSRPTDVSENRSFFGVEGCCQRFLKVVAKTLSLLNDLLKSSDKTEKRKITRIAYHSFHRDKNLQLIENLSHDHSSPHSTWLFQPTSW